MTFDEWAFHQVQILGDSIHSIKGEDNKNIAWINNRTGERFDIKEEDK